MSKVSVEDKNKIIHKRMLKISEISFGPLPHDSQELRPFRMHYVQDDKQKKWDIIKVCESIVNLVFNINHKKLIFVKQFRPASYFGCLPEKKELSDLKKYPVELGLAIELCDGVVDKDKPLVEIAQDELRKKCRYKAPLPAFQKIITYKFVGCAATKQTLFYVEVTDDMSIHSDEGVEENELNEIVEMSVAEVKEYMNSEVINSPPCFLNGVSWFLVNKKDRYEF